MPLALDEVSVVESPANSDAPREAAVRDTPSNRNGAREGRSCLHLYLSEIGKVPLLSQEEERALALRIQQGDGHAREKMIKANLRLVVKIARDYESLGLPLLDLISEGNIGLMKAVGRFDPTKGAKLSTYASWWIKQSIKRALANQSKTIRLPVHMVDKISHLHRAARRLHEVLGRDPTDEELGEELGISASCVAERRVASNRPVSLDAPVGAEDSNTFAHVIEDQNADMPLQKLESKAFHTLLRQLLGDLSSREAQILQARFGLDGSAPQTLDDVAASLGITRERVRQIQKRSITRLRKLLQKTGDPAPRAGK